MGTVAILNLNEIIKKYNTKTFIETGTLYGDAVELASKADFDEIHSIEIMEILANKAKKRFENNPRIKIHHGSSIEILSQILPEIKMNTLFWLDAHFPGVDSRHKHITDDVDPMTRLPLQKELDLIFQKRTSFKDVILMDDLWVYEDGPYETGLFNNHMKRMGWNITRQEIWQRGIDFIYELFGNTHQIVKDYRHQGYIILYPK